MPRVRVRDPARRGLEDEHERRRHRVPRQRQEEPVQPLERGRGGGARRARRRAARCAAGPSSPRRRRRGPPRRRSPAPRGPPGSAHRVVPVAADPRPGAAGEVPRRHRQARARPAASRAAASAGAPRRSCAGARRSRTRSMASAARSAASCSRSTSSSEKRRANSVPDLQRADRPPVDQQRHAEQRAHGAAERMVGQLGLARRCRARRPRAARAGSASVSLRVDARPVLLDVRRRLARRLHDDLAAVALAEHDRGAVDAEHVGDAGQELAQQVLQRERRQRGVGDPPDRVLPARGRLGLGARDLLADELLARPLGLRGARACPGPGRAAPAARRPRRARPRTTGTRRRRRPPASTSRTLDLVARRAARRAGRAGSRGVLADVLRVRHRLERAPEQHALAHAEDLAQRRG